MLFNEDNFKKLSEIFFVDSPCVSILTPTHRAGNNQEDRIRFKNAITEAEKKLQEATVFTFKKMNEKQAKGFLTPAYDLLDNDDFWLHQSDGLAVFIGKDLFEYFILPVRFSSLVYVNHHFYLSPLMQLLNNNDRFFILALSQGEIRFFEAHQYSITPVNTGDLVPKNFTEAMAAEDPEKTLQFHSAGNNAVFHGHGLHKDQKDWQVEQYCRMVDDGLMKMLHDEKPPMIIAGVDELVATYKNISNYKYIVNSNVSGNVENDEPVSLHEKAWTKMQSYFQEKINAKKEALKSFYLERKASTALLEIVPAAVNGRVETLFLAKDSPVLWGTFNEIDNTAHVHENQEINSMCLKNLAAVNTYKNGGEIIYTNQAEMPFCEMPANAVYRY